MPMLVVGGAGLLEFSEVPFKLPAQERVNRTGCIDFVQMWLTLVNDHRVPAKRHVIHAWAPRGEVYRIDRYRRYTVALAGRPSYVGKVHLKGDSLQFSDAAVCLVNLLKEFRVAVFFHLKSIPFLSSVL